MNGVVAIRLYLLGIALCLSQITQASGLDGLWQFPKNYAAFHGQFKQYKSIDLLPKPLVSEGTFRYETVGKLTWMTNHPIENRIEVYPDRIIQIQTDQANVQMKADQYPFVKVISDVFFGIFSGKLPDDHFFVVRKPAKTGWLVELTPVDHSLKLIFTSIILEGDEALKQFTMFEHNGDRLRIEFSKLGYQ